MGIIGFDVLGSKRDPRQIRDSAFNSDSKEERKPCLSPLPSNNFFLILEVFFGKLNAEISLPESKDFVGARDLN